MTGGEYEHMAARDDNASPLGEALAEASSRVDRYRGTNIGEQNTKVSLIMPVLRALGWDVEDLDEVRLEYRRSPRDKPVDYALMLQREPVLFVEAKGLGENLEDRRWASQVISYAAVAGVEWVVPTDGDEYRIYNAHALVPVEDKLFRSVRISEDVEETEHALRLLSKKEVREKSLGALWRSHTVDSRVGRAVSELFVPEPSAWLVRRLARDLDGLTQGDVKSALGRARISLDFPRAEPAARSAAAGESPGPRSSQRSERPRSMERRLDERERKRRAPAVFDVSVADLVSAGLIEPGSTLRKRYLGRDLTGRVEQDGRIRFQDELYDSLSTAAGAARAAVKGPPEDGRRYYQTNGWTFWQYQDDAGDWREMQVLRERFMRSR